MKRLVPVAVGLVIALSAFVGARAYLNRPNAWQSAVLQTVSLRIQSDSIKGGLNDELAALTTEKSIYVAKVAPGLAERDYQIVAASAPGTVGVTLAAFWDQYSAWYASAGPVKGPSGESYMIYVAR